MPISEWAHAMLEVLGAPPAGRTPACVAELVSGVGSLGPRWWNTFRFQNSTRWPASTRGRGHIDRPQGGGVQDRRHADARRRDREARPCDRRADQLASLD